MNASFCSVPFLHLNNPEGQLGNDTTHGGQVFSFGLIKDNPAQANTLHPGHSRFGCVDNTSHYTWLVPSLCLLKVGSGLSTQGFSLAQSHELWACDIQMCVLCEGKKMHKNDLQ